MDHDQNERIGSAMFVLVGFESPDCVGNFPRYNKLTIAASVSEAEAITIRKERSVSQIFRDAKQTQTKMLLINLPVFAFPRSIRTHQQIVISKNATGKEEKRIDAD